MEIFFTQDDLILFAYNETNKTDGEKLFEKMQTNTQLRDNYKSIISMKYCVDSALVSPEERIINNIINSNRINYIE